jgi:hypothetical protein
LPGIATELHADTRGLQWVVDGYNLTFAALVLAVGSLSDRGQPWPPPNETARTPDERRAE